jgi:hypothetical protein
MSSLNVFFNTLEEIGLGKNDCELMRNLANKYKTTDIFQFLKIKIPIDVNLQHNGNHIRGATWPLYHYNGLGMISTLLLRVLVGLTQFMGISDSHLQAINSLITYNGIYIKFQTNIKMKFILNLFFFLKNSS